MPTHTCRERDALPAEEKHHAQKMHFKAQTLQAAESPEPGAHPLRSIPLTSHTAHTPSRLTFLNSLEILASGRCWMACLEKAPGGSPGLGGAAQRTNNVRCIRQAPRAHAAMIRCDCQTQKRHIQLRSPAAPKHSFVGAAETVTDVHPPTRPLDTRPSDEAGVLPAPLVCPWARQPQALAAGHARV